MKIHCRQEQTVAIAQRCVGELSNGDLFTADMWQEGPDIAVVVQFPCGGVLEDIGDLAKRDRDLVTKFILRHATSTFPGREVY